MKYPYIENGQVIEQAEAAPRDDLQSWLAQRQPLTLYVHHPAGDFTVTRAARARGSSYWQAQRVAQGRRGSVYLGKALTWNALDQAGRDIADAIDAQEPIAPRPRVTGRRVLSDAQLDALRASSTPDQLRAAQRRALERADPGDQASLERVLALIDAVWPPRTS